MGDRCRGGHGVGGRDMMVVLPAAYEGLENGVILDRKGVYEGNY